MSVNLQYVASSGTVYNLKGDGIRTKTANYHKWNWGVNGTTLQYGARVAAFTKAAATYETKLIVNGSHAVRKVILDALHEDFECDIRNMTPGRVIWGDYYIDCYATISSTYPDKNGIWTDNDVTFYCPYPFWIREETHEFTVKEAPEGQTYLDYDYDFAYDFFYGNPGIEIWQRDFPFAAEFRMTIYGPVSNPSLTINGHLYMILDTLLDTEYIVIDSRAHTVTKYLADGQSVNIFDKRNKSESVFEQIPAGTLTANWSGEFGFDLTIFEERSEPRCDDGRYADLTGNDAVLTVERW